MKYIIPEYYDHFQCKCGECRHSCCDGWPIRISMQEYYHLLGVKCSDSLRTKLDCALKISLEPGREDDAFISTDWRGICKLHREDGLCALQTELGEGSLPEVCKLYPRNTKKLTEFDKCSCSNSCEAVVELLLNLDKPMQFIEKDLPFKPEFDIGLPSEKYIYCKKSIAIIQDRSMSLPERFIKLGNCVRGTNYYKRNPIDLSPAFQALLVLNNYYVNLTSISDYCETTLSYYGIEGKEKLSAEDLSIINEKYISASKHFETILPDWQVIFEQLIVNHMFYNDFPYDVDLENGKDAFLSLALIYSFLRLNILGYMYDKADTEKLIDFLTSMFRLIEHSDFKKQVVYLFNNEIYSEQNCIQQLLYV